MATDRYEIEQAWVEQDKDWVSPCERYEPRKGWEPGRYCRTTPTVVVKDSEGQTWKLCREHAAEQAEF